MKTTNLILLASAVMALSMDGGVLGSEPACSPSSSMNRALLASPRYLEEHPQFRFVPPSDEETLAKSAQIQRQMSQLMANRALANSPRFLEEHPELLRAAPSAEEAQAKDARIERQLAKLMANRAWAASPRAREEFPALARGLKADTDKGRPSKPIEVGK